jgi:ABC-type Zn2+ transport system substrate-binding protein/surface adhesin
MPRPDHDEHEHDDEGHDHEHGHDIQADIFLTLRQQNLELLRLAAQVAGYGGNNAPIKQDEKRAALERIWDVYSEFYEWIDPEEAEGEGDE